MVNTCKICKNVVFSGDINLQYGHQAQQGAGQSGMSFGAPRLIADPKAGQASQESQGKKTPKF